MTQVNPATYMNANYRAPNSLRRFSQESIQRSKYLYVPSPYWVEQQYCQQLVKKVKISSPLCSVAQDRSTTVKTHTGAILDDSNRHLTSARRASCKISRLQERCKTTNLSIAKQLFKHAALPILYRIPDTPCLQYWHLF
jgi:hypothetical protein